MVDHLEVVAKGRAALLAGHVERERPPGDGGQRWGVSALLRPDVAMLQKLTAFAAEAADVSGAGQWAHGPDLLHVSLRALAPHGEESGLAGYAEALREAARGVPAIRAAVRTVSPHPYGIAVHVHPHGVLDLLYERLAAAMRARGLADFEYWTRDLWYINVVHFAAEVDVERLVAWCDARRDTEFGDTILDAAELVRYHFTGRGMRAETLHREQLL